jgi:hypothetical protein
VATLYAVRVPQGPPQTCCYDDGTGDALSVSGKTMFYILPRELRSVAVRARYARHP